MKYTSGNLPKNMIEGIIKEPCCICGEPTQYLTIHGDNRFCSSECSNLNKTADGFLKNVDNI